jgi:uncharacterized protein HemX
MWVIVIKSLVIFVSFGVTSNQYTNFIPHQAKLLTQAQALRHEAETAVNEMEDAAKTQLHNLANQSQVTLSAIEGRLTRSRRRLDEFQTVVRVCRYRSKKM